MNNSVRKKRPAKKPIEIPAAVKPKKKPPHVTWKTMVEKILKETNETTEELSKRIGCSYLTLHKIRKETNGKIQSRIQYALLKADGRYEVP